MIVSIAMAETAEMVSQDILRSKRGGEEITRDGLEMKKARRLSRGGGGGASFSISEIDEDLHSRQLALYGKDSFRHLVLSNVLISGVGGLGAEVAKNLALAGVRSITLHDERNVELWDLSSNFLVTEENVGQNRAVASLEKLKELNTSVTMSAHTLKLHKEDLSKFQAVVFTETSIEESIEYDEYCHAHDPPIAFIKADVCGLFGRVFCDFGPSFQVNDVNGEDPRSAWVSFITNENPAKVYCTSDERLEFQDGDYVRFSEVEGMSELNDGKPRKIKDVSLHDFTLEENTSQFGAYKRGGLVVQVKMPKTLVFLKYKDALENPGEFLLHDYSKIDRPPLLHLAFRALDTFRAGFKRSPRASSEDDVQTLIHIAKSINGQAANRASKLVTIDETILRHFARGCLAVLNPMAAVFGGIVGQEVVKACTGKFHPIFQFFYFDSLESLPVTLSPEEVMPTNSRYDAQISVLGQEMQDKLGKMKIFLVGAGALGCEFLKNLALMGASCESNNSGSVTVTDDDRIERSNLSRQFLFRDTDISKEKSVVAALTSKNINSNFNVKALTLRAHKQTENVFDENFWENINLAITALDNVQGRRYIDQKCVINEKPLLDSGTLGTKCHTQVIIPHITENYGASRDPEEKEIPMCTIQSFPHNIHHCIAWARDQFDEFLNHIPTQVNSFLSDRSKFLGDHKNDPLSDLICCLGPGRCNTFDDCIARALDKFISLFYEKVNDLITKFPEDHKVTNGDDFWAPPKRFPKPLEFTSTDPTHLSFIKAAATLIAQTYGIPVPEWSSSNDVISRRTEELLQNEKMAKLSLTKIELDPLDSDFDDKRIKLVEDAVRDIPGDFIMKPIEYEKENDTHVELISSMANLRARNYRIQEVDKLKAKIIAGRIVPAIATTTAIASGLVCLELYKVIANHGIEKYRDSYANIGVPMMCMAEPCPAKRYSWKEMSWTCWDKWSLRGGQLTIKRFIKVMRKKKGVKVSSIMLEDGTLLYHFILKKSTMDTKLSDIVHELKERRPRYVDLSICCTDAESGVDVPAPMVRVYFDDQH